jgi:hypothetical protein
VSDWDGGYPDAARALAAVALRLPVRSVDLTPAGGWQADRCGRPPGPRGTGHEWLIYTATTSRTADPPRSRARQARWLDPGEIQQLAARTAEYAHGELTDGQFRARPGIEPTWVVFLAELGIITMTMHDLTAIDRAAQTGGQS